MDNKKATSGGGVMVLAQAKGHEANSLGVTMQGANPCPPHRFQKENIMYGNMTLGKLIAWLEKQDAKLVVKDGFGFPHSDRGDYAELAFSPLPTAKIGNMLKHAKSAVNATFTGWKGGEFKMIGCTSVYIGKDGECGEEITNTHFKYWLLTAKGG